MSNRTLRVNVLIQREISDILRQQYQAESVTVTITEVRVSPDLHDGRVFVSIVGEEDFVTEKLRWLRKKSVVIRRELSKRIILKFLPKLEYVLDHAAVRGTRIVQLLEEVGEGTEAQ